MTVLQCATRQAPARWPRLWLRGRESTGRRHLRARHRRDGQDLGSATGQRWPVLHRGRQDVLPDPNGYTVFGKVVAGLDIVDRIVAEGVAGGNGATDGAPAAPISILRVAVTEKKA